MELSAQVLVGQQKGNSNHVGLGLLRLEFGKKGKLFGHKVTLYRRYRQKQ